jgi:hypothetical protein
MKSSLITTTLSWRVPGPPGWGLGMGLMTTPQKNVVTKPWRRPRPAQDCSTSKEEVMDNKCCMN